MREFCVSDSTTDNPSNTVATAPGDTITTAPATAQSDIVTH